MTARSSTESQPAGPPFHDTITLPGYLLAAAQLQAELLEFRLEIDAGSPPALENMAIAAMNRLFGLLFLNGNELSTTFAWHELSGTFGGPTLVAGWMQLRTWIEVKIRTRSGRTINLAALDQEQLEVVIAERTTPLPVELAAFDPTTSAMYTLACMLRDRRTSTVNERSMLAELLECMGLVAILPSDSEMTKVARYVAMVVATTFNQLDRIPRATP